MYRAKAALKPEDEEEGYSLDDWGIPNDNRWVTGWLIENYIVGPIVDVSEEVGGVVVEWWCKIDPATLTRVEEER